MKLLLALLPLLYWQYGIETAPQLKQAGIEQIAAPPDKVDAWREAGFKVTAMPKNELEGRERLLIPGVARRANVASPTRVPWVDANGWRFLRRPEGQYLYDVTAGRAALAAAEAFVYNADVVVKIEPSDLEAFGKTLAFLRTLPTDEMPSVADFTLTDDGSTTTGEIMNLLMRRNLLFQLSKSPSSLYRLHVKIGTRAYPLDSAADPSAFAQRLRQQIGDDKRTIRIYGSEVVIARVLSDSTKLRLHLLNYGGREIEGLRVRLRGKFANGSALVAGVGRVSLEEFLVADGATEFTIPKMMSYALIELPFAK
ncbi:MAG TPA: hypothetical protein VFZ34_21420 [Blastocatellia bacterium]|nr:hypothetical protein [Blastocatellia bacterium]